MNVHLELKSSSSSILHIGKNKINISIDTDGGNQNISTAADALENMVEVYNEDQNEKDINDGHDNTM